MIKLKDLLLEQTPQGRMCANCRWFIEDRHWCTLLTPMEVEPQGICDVWAHGDPSTSDQLRPRLQIRQDDVNYTDDYKTHPFNTNADTGPVRGQGGEDI